MSVLSLVGNVLAIVAIAKDPHRTSLCMMILHLSVADLFVAFFCLAGESIWTYTVSWNAGNIMCKAVKYWQVRANAVRRALIRRRKRGKKV